MILKQAEHTINLGSDNTISFFSSADNFSFSATT